MRKLTLPLLFALGVLFSVSLPAFAAGGASTTTTTTTTPTTTAATTTTTAATTTTTAATTTTTAGAPATPTTPDAKSRPHLHWFAGSVTAVGGSSLTVGVLWTGPKDGSFNGQSLTVSVTDQTRIDGPHNAPIALAQIQSGDLVAVRAAGDPSSGLTAARIHVFCNCHWIGGTIGSITPGSSSGTGSFTVAVTRTGPYDSVLENTTVTLQVNADSVYLRGPHKARLGFGDLKVGEGVGVVFAANGFFKAPGFNPATATFTAKRVHVWAKRQVPPSSTDASASAGVSVG